MFFGLPTLADHLRGRISPHDMRPEDREIRALEKHGHVELINVYDTDMEPKDPMEFQATVLPSAIPRAQRRGGFSDFKRLFDELSGGLSDCLNQIHGLVFAGGSVTAAICECGHGDCKGFFGILNTLLKEIILGGGREKSAVGPAQETSTSF